MIQPPKTYKHLFFDLDRTLWDFERSALLTFREMHSYFGIRTDFEEFYSKYQDVNHALWELYKENRIGKEDLAVQRFSLTLDHFGTEHSGDLPLTMAEYYRTHSPQKVSLFEGCHELLSYLHGRYRLHIITNGFEEIQHVKLERGGLALYFDNIVTSERAGHKKPDHRIFRFALDLAQAKPEESLMIGDEPEVDIKGARDVGMDQALVHSTDITIPATFNFPDLISLKSIL